LAGRSINEYKFDANIGENNIPIELGNKYTGQLLIQINDGKKCRSAQDICPIIVSTGVNKFCYSYIECGYFIVNTSWF
jgi:hypothetical protein